MAQTNYTPISLYYSTTAAAVPVNTNLVNGELAINITDGKLFYKDNGGTVQVLATKGAGTIGGSNTQVQYNNSGALAGSANLTFNGTTLTANTLNLTNALGTTYGGTGLTSFTANGVVYASSTSALTTGSALTFDGTKLVTTATTNAVTTYPAYFDNSGAGAGTGARIGFRNTGSAYGEIGYVFSGGFGFILDSAGSNDTRFLIGGSEQMRLTSTGLGIGTTSPGAPLSIAKNGTGAYTEATWSNSNSTASLAIGVGGSLVGVPAIQNNAYLYNTGNSAMVFGTNNAEKMRLDSSGNLGLGVTPSAWLTSSGVKALQVGSASILGQTIAGSAWLSNNAFFDGANKYIVTGVAQRYAQGDTGFHAWYTAPSGTAGNPITFTQAMTLDASGNLLVGDTTTGAYFDSKANFYSPATYAAFGGKQGGVAGASVGLFWHTATSGDNSFAVFLTEASPTVRGSITYNRGAGLVAYNVTSDYRAKDILGPVIDSGTLIDSVPVYMGKMKDATQERPMFIAHETPAYAHTGVKDAVDADGKPVYQQMDASALIPVMWAEIQSLRIRIAQLEAK
jgi:hypothetical protein